MRLYKSFLEGLPEFPLHGCKIGARESANDLARCGITEKVSLSKSEGALIEAFNTASSYVAKVLPAFIAGCENEKITSTFEEAKAFLISVYFRERSKLKANNKAGAVEILKSEWKAAGNFFSDKEVNAANVKALRSEIEAKLTAAKNAKAIAAKEAKLQEYAATFGLKIEQIKAMAAAGALKF